MFSLEISSLAQICLPPVISSTFYISLKCKTKIKGKQTAERVSVLDKSLPHLMHVYVTF